MTILMTFIGSFVFMFSIFTVGFKSAFKRLLAFTAAGFAIDVLIITLAVLTQLAITY